MLLPATGIDDDAADDDAGGGEGEPSRSPAGGAARLWPSPTPPAWVLGEGASEAVARTGEAGTSPPMNAHPASAADGHSLAERHRADTLAREIRGAGIDPAGTHLRLVTDPTDAEPAARSWSPLSGGAALSPLAEGARAVGSTARGG